MEEWTGCCAGDELSPVTGCHWQVQHQHFQSFTQFQMFQSFIQHQGPTLSKLHSVSEFALCSVSSATLRLSSEPWKRGCPEDVATWSPHLLALAFILIIALGWVKPDKVESMTSIDECIFVENVHLTHRKLCHILNLARIRVIMNSLHCILSRKLNIMK